ncbi:MAG: branched-chain amino acid transport system ATP-binding protein livF [Actinomycetota bacterium]|jgi:ABC-type branched-subunit amino acid transport system ATPase component/MFS family permease|nr:branched-chain amino acid transport system ATP-binding protein livF [Actinomycetota bacterium]
MTVTASREDADTGSNAEAVTAIEQTKTRLAGVGRSALGVTGETGSSEPLRTLLRRHGVSLYAVTALGVLAIVDQFQIVAFTIMGPEISHSLGVSRTALGGILGLALLSVSLAALPVAAYVQNRPRRATLSVGTGFGWSLATLSTAFVANPFSLAGILVLDGASTGSVNAVHEPLLFDQYPPEARVRALSIYRAFDYAGRILAPALVAVLTGVFLLTWRGVFLVMGVVSVLACVYSVRLRDPGFGVWDTSRIRDAVRSEGELQPTPRAETASKFARLGFFEIVRRLYLIPTVRKLFTTNLLLGMMYLPLLTYLAFFLDERFNLGPSGRGVFTATTPILALIAFALYGSRAEATFRRSPSDLMRNASVIFALGLVCLFVGVLSPNLVGAWLGFGGMSALLGAATPALSAGIQAVIAPQMRPHASAMSGILIYGVGGFLGLTFLGGLDKRYGLTVSIALLAVPAAAAALVLFTARKTIDADLDRLIGEVVEEEELNVLRSKGVNPPLLACRHIDFSYGQLKVLFDVSFDVQEGEMVALLGTNGAGKSTLLRCISGLGLPSAGTMRLNGDDITYLDPQKRVRLGVSQIPGGRAVFPRLSVVDNMRAYGYSLGRNRSQIDDGIDRTLAAFPRLAERRNVPAGVLSGGEAQMLGLGKALLLRPKLLLIDELSLGLAPKVVGELLTMVRSINAEGTAVVLVEQSVNVALSLVEHAYFMERGQIRFDGRAADLLGRGDLLRSVFLEGATRRSGR